MRHTSPRLTNNQLKLFRGDPMQKHIKTLLLMAIAVFLVCSVASEAQTITGSVNGTVTDPSGAVIPNATVTATNVDTGVATPTTTNNDGIYNIRFLQIGNYKVTVEASGFAVATYGPFVLETGQNAKIDGKLGVAGAQQRVSIEAEVAPLLNTENPTLATTLDTRAIENVPMVSRNIVALTMFLPGAISTNPNGFVNQAAISGPLSTNSGNSVSVNGNRQQTNQYLLDGMNINQTLDDTPGYNPSVNTWANKHTVPTMAKNSFTRNIFGGTFGGPIFHDRLFFFADYQGGRYHLAGPANATVLTMKQRQGDFSELLDSKI